MKISRRVFSRLLASVVAAFGKDAAISDTLPQINSKNVSCSPPRRLDLTGSFTDLGFEGYVEISLEGDRVVYRLPTFRINFIRSQDIDIKCYIHLDTFSLLIASDNPEKRKEYYFPIDSNFNENELTHVFDNVYFFIPSSEIIASSYVMFSVVGMVTFKPTGKDAELISGAMVRKTWRAHFPISARENSHIEYRRGLSRPEMIYKALSDPTDPCAPERIR